MNHRQKFIETLIQTILVSCVIIMVLLAVSSSTNTHSPYKQLESTVQAMETKVYGQR